MAQGSTGNVVAALASAVLPGLGQLAQGRVFAAAVFFLLFAALWVVWLGWLIHIVACIDAARWQGPN